MTREQQVAALREKAIRLIRASMEYPIPDKFTCDDCQVIFPGELPAGGVCPWAFDLYNTDGDCLAMK